MIKCLLGAFVGFLLGVLTSALLASASRNSGG